MRVILSRKGFDSSYGKIPSPVMPDGTMLSLPIPSELDDDKSKIIKYSDLIYRFKGKEFTYREIISSLYDTPNSKYKYGRKDDLKKYFGVNGPSKGKEYCHLDPDLVLGLNPNAKDSWKAAFGQISAAQTHLSNQGINKESIDNDILFLFFGWFCETEYEGKKLIYSGNNSFQAIYGYMFVKDILKNDAIKSSFPWHPHSSFKSSNNTLYVAKEKQIINGKEHPGFGTFKYNDLLRLTKNDESQTRWDYTKLPTGMKEGRLILSYHDERSAKQNYFQSATIGQEFVFNENDEVAGWALRLITNSIIN